MTQLTRRIEVLQEEQAEQGTRARPPAARSSASVKVGGHNITTVESIYPSYESLLKEEELSRLIDESAKLQMAMADMAAQHSRELADLRATVNALQVGFQL